MSSMRLIVSSWIIEQAQCCDYFCMALSFVSKSHCRSLLMLNLIEMFAFVKFSMQGFVLLPLSSHLTARIYQIQDVIFIFFEL